jgi:hypothetical protein
LSSWQRLGYLGAEEQESLLEQAAEIGKIIAGLRRSCRLVARHLGASLTTDH